ncbi:hypothetical protein LEP1GSC036_3257 [Leptospira weilii str. 2006001853]|uniref:Uncharacterized protein n=2 Tax=Leptospira weilii TaxID=28184 RepID=A0A828Z363_9LEPT|nr:hypothetical protein LEP1GSC036_3257 [Leptospira weilii str. 2006001853]EMJ63573.1 hypothetical protein LEP1GSC051_0054 [Leptospira sp. P2653]EMM73757.1 hypothetical protein LEP1GSC038_3448 [Leptospira weilii str. 2006001855]EMN43661.1 hypothetical protein LEP1GSC086_3591 [Leptospira weilii str. LNT 1234]QDK22490.1 hypothetical protein FHG67_06995 [Leptospira weilii]
MIRFPFENLTTSLRFPICQFLFASIVLFPESIFRRRESQKTIIYAYRKTIEILYSMIHGEILEFHIRTKFENFPITVLCKK